MNDKSPRQAMTKKSGKSLKEKRGAKRDKNAASQAISAVEKVVGKKKK